MPTLTLPDATYVKALRLAAAANLPVEQFVAITLEAMPSPKDEPTKEERLQALECIAQRAKERAHRYPPGFQVDDSRESIYKEREDAQR